jgi:hypothetical protein
LSILRHAEGAQGKLAGGTRAFFSAYHRNKEFNDNRTL